MTKVKKLFITILMVFVWGWTLFMGLSATHLRGRLASWGIGLSINVLLAFYYSYLAKRPHTLRDWFKQ